MSGLSPVRSEAATLHNGLHIFALAGVLAGVLACAGNPGGTSCPDGLLFDSDRTGRPNLFLLPVGRTEPSMLTSHAATSSDYSRVPDWSPDKRRVVFHGRRGELEGLFVIPCAGGEATPLPNTTGGGSPAWSPTGDHIAFVRNARIYILDLTTDSVRDVPGVPDATYYPAWSPDGTMIAFVSKQDSAWEIFVLDMASGRSRQLTHAPVAGGSSQGPTWSPDGTRIAFDRILGEDFDILVMNSDGSNVVRLTNGMGIHARPAWSPGGDRIAFHSTMHRPANAAADDRRFFEIYSMRADGTRLTRLTNNTVFDGHPDWR